MKIYKTIDLEEYCKGGMSTREEGRDVLVLVLKLWKRVEKITLDFKNIKVASVSFTDEVFGTLAMHFSNDELRAKLDLVNIDEIDKQMINAAIASRRKELKEIDSNN